jgi:hypothetical protein
MKLVLCICICVMATYQSIHRSCRHSANHDKVGSTRWTGRNSNDVVVHCRGLVSTFVIKLGECFPITPPTASIAPLGDVMQVYNSGKN